MKNTVKFTDKMSTLKFINDHKDDLNEFMVYNEDCDEYDDPVEEIIPDDTMIQSIPDELLDDKDICLALIHTGHNVVNIGNEHLRKADITTNKKIISNLMLDPDIKPYDKTNLIKFIDDELLKDKDFAKFLLGYSYDEIFERLPESFKYDDDVLKIYFNVARSCDIIKRIPIDKLSAPLRTERRKDLARLCQRDINEMPDDIEGQKMQIFKAIALYDIMAGCGLYEIPDDILRDREIAKAILLLNPIYLHVFPNDTVKEIAKDYDFIIELCEIYANHPAHDFIDMDCFVPYLDFHDMLRTNYVCLCLIARYISIDKIPEDIRNDPNWHNTIKFAGNQNANKIYNMPVDMLKELSLNDHQLEDMLSDGKISLSYMPSEIRSDPKLMIKALKGRKILDSEAYFKYMRENPDDIFFKFAFIVNCDWPYLPDEFIDKEIAAIMIYFDRYPSNWPDDMPENLKNDPDLLNMLSEKNLKTECES